MDGAKKPYSVNKRYMSWIGQWPDQTPLQRFLWSTNVIFAVTGQCYMQIRGMIAAWSDWDLVIECSSPIVIDILSLVKLFNCLFNFSKISRLLACMRNDWNILPMDTQIKILHSYTENGRKLTNTYAGIMFGAMGLYMALPHVPTIMALISGSNETLPRGLLYHVETVVDVEKYYYLVLLHSYYTTFCLMTLPVATDTMYIVYTYHACGMLSAIGYEMENVIKDDSINVDINIHRAHDLNYSSISSIILKHKSILEYIELLVSTYTTSFLILTALNVIVMTFSGVQAVIYLNKPEEALRFGATAMTLCCHFLFLSFPGQKLIDHSTAFHNSISSCKWYALSIQGRKLMNMMLIRSRQPCEIRAGKVCVMSLQTFSSVIRASMSYFTVLTSLR